MDISEQIKKHGLENRVRVPRLFAQFATKTTLVEEFLDGVTLDDIINNRAPLSEPERLRVANAFQRDLIRQCIRGWIFPRRPPSGQPTGIWRWAHRLHRFRDYGPCGNGSGSLASLLKGAVKLDAKYATEGLVALCSPASKNQARELFARKPRYEKAADIVFDFIIRNLSEDLGPITEEWHKQSGNLESALLERSSAVTFFKMVRAAAKYGMISFPRMLSDLYGPF